MFFSLCNVVGLTCFYKFAGRFFSLVCNIRQCYKAVVFQCFCVVCNQFCVPVFQLVFCRNQLVWAKSLSCPDSLVVLVGCCLICALLYPKADSLCRMRWLDKLRISVWVLMSFLYVWNVSLCFIFPIIKYMKLTLMLFSYSAGYAMLLWTLITWVSSCSHCSVFQLYCSLMTSTYL